MTIRIYLMKKVLFKIIVKFKKLFFFEDKTIIFPSSSNLEALGQIH